MPEALICLQEQSNRDSEATGLQASGKLVCKAGPMNRADNISAAPITGISCSLIDELPTMALPMADMLMDHMLEGLDQECPDFVLPSASSPTMCWPQAFESVPF